MQMETPFQDFLLEQLILVLGKLPADFFDLFEDIGLIHAQIPVQRALLPWFPEL